MSWPPLNKLAVASKQPVTKHILLTYVNSEANAAYSAIGKSSDVTSQGTAANLDFAKQDCSVFESAGLGLVYTDPSKADGGAVCEHPCKKQSSAFAHRLAGDQANDVDGMPRSIDKDEASAYDGTSFHSLPCTCKTANIAGRRLRFCSRLSFGVERYFVCSFRVRCKGKRSYVGVESRFVQRSKHDAEFLFYEPFHNVTRFAQWQFSC